jgi:hypothetical protein
MGNDRGVVNQYVDLAKAIHGLVDHLLNAVFIANVDMKRERFGQLSKLASGFLGLFLIQVRNDNLGLGLCKRRSGMSTNALPAAGYNDYFIFKHDPSTSFWIAVCWAS